MRIDHIKLIFQSFSETCQGEGRIFHREAPLPRREGTKGSGMKSERELKKCLTKLLNGVFKDYKRDGGVLKFSSQNMLDNKIRLNGARNQY